MKKILALLIVVGLLTPLATAETVSKTGVSKPPISLRDGGKPCGAC